MKKTQASLKHNHENNDKQLWRYTINFLKRKASYAMHINTSYNTVMLRCKEKYVCVKATQTIL